MEKEIVQLTVLVEVDGKIHQVLLTNEECQNIIELLTKSGKISVNEKPIEGISFSKIKDNKKDNNNKK